MPHHRPSLFLQILDELQGIQHSPEPIEKVRVRIRDDGPSVGRSQPPTLIDEPTEVAVPEPMAAPISEPVKAKPAPAPAAQHPRPSKPRTSDRARRKPDASAPRAPRSQQAIDSASAKLTEQRLARIAVALPLIADARAAGFIHLREICDYLDQIGHKPQKGEKWSTASLSRILSHSTDHRETRAIEIEAAIDQARSDGAATMAQIADWLNAHGHRTINNLPWTRTNVDRFEKSRRSK